MVMIRSRSTLLFAALGLAAVAGARYVGAFTIPTSSVSNVLRHRTSSTRSRIVTLHSQSPFNGGESAWYEDSLTAPASRQRRPILAGNWKLNPSTLPEACNLLNLLASNFINHDRASPPHRDTSDPLAPEVIVFPPFPYLSTAVSILEGTGIKVGAQNIGLQKSGAHTGEVAASMVRSLGCDYVLLGHSERRSIYKEGEGDINAKVHLCLEEVGLGVILCVGETEAEYDAGLLESVVDMQIKKGLSGASAQDLERIVVAYEPVWAIGTGKVATPDQAQVAHIAVRRTLATMFGYDAAQAIRVQYGGSVTPESIEALMAMPDVDGALVGGASLTADSFSRIVDGAGGVPAAVSPRPRELTAREVVSTKNVLGESPVWSVRDQALYWISAPEEEVWMWNQRDAPFRRLYGTTLGCVAVAAGHAGSLLLAGERAFLTTTMGPQMSDFASGASVLCDRPEQTETTRPNDGRVDREGRLVFGMYNNYHRAGSSEGQNNAGLYRLNANLEAEEILDYRYRVSNCICFSPDGRTLYFCDTPTRKLYAFDYPKEGPLKNRRLIWTMPPNLPGGPDGAQTDSQGYIWMALSGASRVVRVDPSTGVVDTVVHLPVNSPTSCTFGGADLDELFITTRGPDGGGLYRVKMPFGIKGLPEPEFGSTGAATLGTSHAYGQEQLPATVSVKSPPASPPFELY